MQHGDRLDNPQLSQRRAARNRVGALPGRDGVDPDLERSGVLCMERKGCAGSTAQEKRESNGSRRHGPRISPLRG
jgi:hypothetical protein